MSTGCGQLRIQIRCKNNSPVCWSMSVILYSNAGEGRIDCIDWEPTFVTIDGVKASGFHRHIWDPKKKSCEHSKVALPQFNPQSVEEFIRMGFGLMGIEHDPSRGGFQW